MSDHISSKDNSGQAAAFAAMLYVVLCVVAIVGGVPVPYVLSLTVVVVIGIVLWHKKKRDILQKNREKDVSK
jgi:type III secretory pathway component EscV